MSIPFVDLKAQYESIKEEIDQAIVSVIDQTAFIGGDVIRKFEASFAQFSGMNHCVGCANGTDAIEIALKALGIGPGDEVLVPALTWISTAGAVNNVGAEPVFIDVLADERTIDPSLLEEKITNKTRAIIPVHLYGLPARMEQIMTIAKKHGLKVVEDCAQAHGAEIAGRKVGAFGHIATYSFYPGKNLGAYGDAGAITTNDEEVAKTSRMIANHGQQVKHDHRIIGRNSRLDTLQAAILNVKLPYLPEWTEKRIRVAEMYCSQLKGVKLPVVPKGFNHVFHVYVIQHERRDEIKKHLDAQHVGNAIHYPVPLPHLASYSYKGHRTGDFPVAEKLCAEILSLPMFPEMSEAQVARVCEIVNSHV